MKKIVSYYLGFSVLFFIFSCTENETITDTSTLDKGGLAIFANKVVQTASKPAGKYVADIKDAGDNIASYKIVSISANIDGVAYPAESVSYIYTLPTKLELDFSTLAALYGLTAADIDYGDVFNIIAEVKTKDGRVFGGVIPYTNGNVPSATLIDPINNTTSEVLNGGFKSALKFSFTVACPNYTQSDMYGTYKVIVDEWDEYFFRTPVGFSFQCVAGPRPNSLKFVNFTNFGTDMIVDVDPSAQTATSPKVRTYANPYFGGYTDASQEGVSGLVFSCLGIVKLSTQQSVAQGTFGGRYEFTVKKQ